MKSVTFFKELQHKFSEHADQQIAKKQQAYMKSAMPFWGIPVPQVRRIVKECANKYAPENNAEYREMVNHIFMHATHREEWYAAMIIAQQFKKFIDEQNIDIYIGFIEKGQWWDIVDVVSSNLIGIALHQNKNLERHLQAWIKHENMWIRRTALLTQLMHKEKTNFALQENLILQVAHEKEFFIRKAIGWTLRQYSKTDPDAVRTFIAAHSTRLSSLSIKEGSKYI